MKILLFGKNDQVGWELRRSLEPLGLVIALERNAITYFGELNNTTGIIDTSEKIRPNIIINVAAYTAVDKAESESDSTEPLNTYGKRKHQGEEFITEKCSRYLIFCTIWFYALQGKKFVKTLLDQANHHEQLTIIDDQFGAPTDEELLADSTAHTLLKERLFGIYHLVASGSTTWYDYVKFILNERKVKGLKFKVKEITPIPTEAIETTALRPKNSRLNDQKFQHAFNLTLPYWRLGLIRMLNGIR